MKQRNMILDQDACIHCDRCKKHCTFLTKYDLDIGDKVRLKELAYNCFLCGKCSEVCPKNIDGRQIILNMRIDEVRENRDKLAKDGYTALLLEKKDYIFKNYKSALKRSILFPGCNYPSFYPKTTAMLSKMLFKEASMGTVFDCCGKPIAELGLVKEEDRIIASLEKRFKREGIEELVTMCPNCYHYLKPKLGIRVRNIYDKFKELGIGDKIKGDISVFMPCPDRECKEILEDIKDFVDGDIKGANKAQCCGMGGCAVVRERELAMDMAKTMSVIEEDVYTYCATCAGNLERNGGKALRHIVNEIIGSKERADIKSSFINRLKTKFIRNSFDS